MIGLAFVLSQCARPVAKFKVEFPSGSMTVPTQVQLINESENAEEFSWYFGDGSESNSLHPAHKYWSSGRYKITLEAKKGKKSDVRSEEVIIEPTDQCLVRMKTQFGDMTLLLYEGTPKHRDNFLKLAEKGFYDSLLFHRVIENFMVQGGDPASKNSKPGMGLGSGGPGYTIPAEFSPQYIHKKGAIAAARTGDQVNPEKRSSGSQFYIVHGSPIPINILKSFEEDKKIQYSDKQKRIYMDLGGTPYLDMEYTVFGEVIQGLNVIDSIAVQATDGRNRPVQDIIMEMQVIH